MDQQKCFYSDLKPFQKFEDFTLTQHYSPLPDSWVVFLTDIKGSTKAIEQGRYKDVNLIGAATITTTLNISKNIEFPYVFGGDGATLCVPKGLENTVERELGKLKNLAQSNFDLELRVAKIPAQDIYKHNKDILVAKFEITQGRSIAVFRGGGLALADELAKQHYEKYKASLLAETTEELEGLSCRWNPIPSKKDKILSLLIVAKESQRIQTYDEVISQLKKIMKTDLESSNPINMTQASYKSFTQNFIDEIRYHKRKINFNFMKRLISIVFSQLIFKLKITNLFFDARPYTQSIPSHSDFRKFDDTLRLIIDCTYEEKTLILEYLENQYQNHKLFYGSHLSDEALMTCYVQDLQNGNHIHFIDGGNGGYAMAAKQLKQQMLSSSDVLID